MRSRTTVVALGVSFACALLLAPGVCTTAEAASDIQLGITGTPGANGDAPSGRGGKGSSGLPANASAVATDPDALALAEGGEGGSGGRGADGDWAQPKPLSPQGGDGGDGAAGGSASASAGATISSGIPSVSATAQGGAGGSGGDGGGGVPNGNGADAADGGSATAHASLANGGSESGTVEVEATGGSGGDAGLGGFVGTQHGSEGMAGNGGKADAGVELQPSGTGATKVTIDSSGGGGGNGSGGGRGGNASATFTAASHGAVDVTATVTGGFAGLEVPAPIPGSNGTGGDATFTGTSSSDTDVTEVLTVQGGAPAPPPTFSDGLGGSGGTARLRDDVTTGGALDVHATVTGGAAGRGDPDVLPVPIADGTAGSALADGRYASGGNGRIVYEVTSPSGLSPSGSAELLLDAQAGGDLRTIDDVRAEQGTSLQATLKAAGFLNADLTATSGLGTASIDARGTGSGTSARIDGESRSSKGFASTTIEVANTGAARATGIARGGTAPSASGIAGNGIGASADVTATSTGGGPVTVYSQVYGGNGGSDPLGGGGRGASIGISNIARGDTTGALELTQLAVGGDGGYSNLANPGAAGDAESDLGVVNTDSRTVTLNAAAYGGVAGSSGTVTPANPGGLGKAIAEGTTTAGALTVTTDARGGHGARGPTHGSAGGTGSAIAKGTTNGDGHPLTIQGNADGGDGGTGASLSLYGNGGDAVSSSAGVNHGDNIGTVRDFANGGAGASGGSASSRADFDVGEGGGTASASATGGAFLAPGGAGGAATAMASIDGSSSTSDVYANASAVTTLGAPASARAMATGHAGQVAASAVSTGVSAQVIQVVGSSVDVEARTGVGTPAPSAGEAAGRTGYAFVTRNPTNGDALRALQGNALVHHDFDVGGSSELLQLVSLGGSYPSDGAGSPETFSLSFSQQLALGDLGSLQHLVLGLLASDVSGVFDSIHFTLTENGVAAVDEAFGDAGAFLSYFGDHSLDLGELAGQPATLDLGFAFDFTSHTAGSGFAASMLLGNTTPGVGPPAPEPGTAWLLATGVAWLAGWRRRRP